jgi:hypothetical protein
MSKDPVLSALSRQVECYRSLAKLAQVQHEHVCNGRTEDLLMVLSQRQDLLDQVADLEQCIVEAKRSWSDFKAKLPADQRAEAESMLQQTRKLLEEITAADRDDAMVLQQRKLNLGREINRATAARRVNTKYATAAYGQRKAALDIQR